MMTEYADKCRDYLSRSKIKKIVDVDVDMDVVLV
jgi:hypothetical protein